jgi:hypothetical protein
MDIRSYICQSSTVTAADSMNVDIGIKLWISRSRKVGSTYFVVPLYSVKHRTVLRYNSFKIRRFTRAYYTRSRAHRHDSQIIHVAKHLTTTEQTLLGSKALNNNSNGFKAPNPDLRQSLLVRPTFAYQGCERFNYCRKLCIQDHTSDFARI